MHEFEEVQICVDLKVRIRLQQNSPNEPNETRTIYRLQQTFCTEKSGYSKSAVIAAFPPVISVVCVFVDMDADDVIVAASGVLNIDAFTSVKMEEKTVDKTPLFRRKHMALLNDLDYINMKHFTWMTAEDFENLMSIRS